MSNNRLSLKFLGRRINPCRNSSSSSSSLDEDVIEVLKYSFYKSYVKLTSDLPLVVCTCSLQVGLFFCKNTSRTPVKVLLNWISTKFHKCSDTSVLTSRRLATRTGLVTMFIELIFACACKNKLGVQLVNYKCKLTFY